jgi:hypothetical protein
VMVTAELITILAGMQVGLKSVVISRTTGLYGLKFAKSSARWVIFSLNLV